MEPDAAPRSPSPGAMLAAGAALAVAWVYGRMIAWSAEHDDPHYCEGDPACGPMGLDTATAIGNGVIRATQVLMIVVAVMVLLPMSRGPRGSKLTRVAANVGLLGFPIGFVVFYWYAWP